MPDVGTAALWAPQQPGDWREGSSDGEGGCRDQGRALGKSRGQSKSEALDLPAV